MIKFNGLDGELFLVGQLLICARMEIPATAYLVAKWLKCTPITARRKIGDMVDSGLVTFSVDEKHPRQAYVANLTENGFCFFQKYRTEYADILISVMVSHYVGAKNK